MRSARTFSTGLLAWSSAAGLAAAAVVAPPRPAPAPPAVAGEAGDFFEAKVRPVLAASCFTCHAGGQQMAGLRLDSRAALLKGGGRGPAVVPGQPEKSLLIQALSHAGALKMPPAAPLPAEQVAALSQWVKMGAPWAEFKSKVKSQKAKEGEGAGSAGGHWAFQPVRRPAMPVVKNRGWVRTPIDAFVLARLEAKGLRPNPPADPRVLIRRATFDLTGLPPTAEEVEAFVRECEAERQGVQVFRRSGVQGKKPGPSGPNTRTPQHLNASSPSAYERLIDGLLASPRYGERWGRYWLDVARYADTKGYVFQEERKYPYAYTYRDWVIQAFNDDVPYDQFLIRQIAADHVAGGEDKRSLAALGFLTLGRRFLNNQHDIIDDRIDVLCRGTMALTVSCARCHDHKFDPIPAKDYYSLYGVFASSVEPKDLPLIAEPKRTPAYLAYEKELKERDAEVQRFLDEKRAEAVAKLRAQVTPYLLVELEARKEPTVERIRSLARSRDLNSTVLQRWHDFLDETRKGHDPVFAPWHAFSAVPEAEFPARAPALAAQFAAKPEPQRPVHPAVAQAFAGSPPSSLREVAERYEKLLTQDPLRQALDGPNGPVNVSPNEVSRLLDRDARNRLQSLQRKVDQLKASSPHAPPRAMALVDAPQPYEPYVFLRGNPGLRGDKVPRQFLSILAGEQRVPFKQGSGRLELARAIASPDNPLTARVMVNRVWMQHFGAPLVATPGDFGLRSEPPTHPELLDWLAGYFVGRSDGVVEYRSDGFGVRTPNTPALQHSSTPWSLKSLHRLIMLSSAYRMSSGDQGRAAGVDPENRLLWRMNRRRLDLEGLRDSLLAVSGQLDETRGGPSVELTTAPFSRRRTIYGFIDRQNLQGLFRTFDFASPDTTTPQRHSTTVPQQALFMLNSPFVVEQARAVATRAEAGGGEDATARLTALYRFVYSRPPTAAELRLGQQYLARAGANSAAVRVSVEGRPASSGLTPWERYAQALLMANEFAFID